ncbi:hypothetical protein Q8F55_008073 [Vanrija albida]|uniref:Uncharacterized protein n=1 Tax=Vanrija albida TaxID=181172 RepID=A0ABR3PVA1_9TREE
MRATPPRSRQLSGKPGRPHKIHPAPPPHMSVARVPPASNTARTPSRARPPFAVRDEVERDGWADDESSEFGDSASEASFYSAAHACGSDCGSSDDGDSVATVLDSPDVAIPSPTSTITSLPGEDAPTHDSSVGLAEKKAPSADYEYGLLSNYARKVLDDLGPDWKPDWVSLPQESEPLDPTAPEFEDLLVRAWVAIHAKWQRNVAEATRTGGHYNPILLVQSTQPQHIPLHIVHMWLDISDNVDNLAVIASYLWFDDAAKLPPPPGYPQYEGAEVHATPRYPKLQTAKRDYAVPQWAFEDGTEVIMKRYNPVYLVTLTPRISPRILRRLLDGDIPDVRVNYPLWVPAQSKSKWLWWF